ncbi:NAD(P)/FAD-dependent oxidoreductase [Paenisporosarcina cavernae]|uniref:FAD-binding oxidoreductase n=1 Tax=Paenisporosarcina cavernae TaxID=2320858 RepID=A0A385YPS2_9BACL|nr:FAD-dependent oxidoreductase [Paenisporosarcina cavernae]AYC28596.1 FAD-binding oxidoreductase [Paenisporosarcina cavernae]
MTNVIIIGGGILGSSTAYHLTKLGAEVTVIDRADSTQATDAAAGIICPWVSQRRNKDWYLLARKGAAYYTQLIPDLERQGQVNTGYEMVGALSLHEDREKLEKMVERTLKRKEDAPEIGDVVLLSPKEVQQKLPLLPETMHAVYVSGAARVDGRALREALREAAIRNGAHFVNGDAKIRKDGVRFQVVVGDSTYSCDKLVLTTGAWGNELLSSLNVDLPVSAQKAQIIHLQTVHHTSVWPVVMPPGDQYLLGFNHGRVVIGATHENEDPFNPAITAGGMLEVLQKGIAVASELEDAEIAEVRVGVRPFTANFLPVIGEVIPKVYVANGLGSSGLTVGPFLGDQLAKLTVDFDTDIDLTPYHPFR